MNGNLNRRHGGLKLSLLIVLITACVGCNFTEPESTSTVHDIKIVDGNKCTPVRIAIIQDNTGSITWTGTPIFKVEDLEPLIQMISRCGGEIGFGLISDNSNKGMIRLAIYQPPIEPAPPSRAGNPFKVAQRMESYTQEMKGFKITLAAWQGEAEKRIVEFKSNVERSLKSCMARRSDVWEALRRVDIFLSEDASAWGQEPFRYAILITDGQDNVGKNRIASIHGKLILVNGNSGALEGLKPSRFESIGSAVSFVIADAERGH